MDKTIMGILGTGMLGWMGILTGKKVDKSACDAVHKGVCDKLDLIKDDVAYIRSRLDSHLDGDKP